MNRQKFLRVLAVLMLVICLLVSVSTLAGADFGDFGGDGDYGGGDDGGDFGGWDDDYSSRSYDDSSSGEDSSLGILIAVVLIGVIVFVEMRRQKKQAPGTANAATDADGLTAMEHYISLDPNFSEAELTAKLSNLYVQMQQGWTAKDISSLRPYFTDAYFAQMERQLDEHKRSKRTNHIDRIAVLYVKLLGYRQQGDNDEIIAQLQSRIVDYTVSDDTGALLSGSKTAEKLMTYEYTLMRPAGQKTVPETEVAVTNCPNCGAPVNINRTAKCPFCDSIITVNNQNFVISSIRGIAQKTL